MHRHFKAKTQAAGSASVQISRLRTRKLANEGCFGTIASMENPGLREGQTCCATYNESSAEAGKRFLRIDTVVDERLDTYKATVAAARLLRENHRLTKAWPLAITAYNHGAGGMRRATKKLGTTDIAKIVEKYRSRTRMAIDFKVQPLFAIPYFRTNIGHAITEEQVNYIQALKMVRNQDNLISENLYIFEDPQLASIKAAVQEALDCYASEVMGISHELYVTQSWSLVNHQNVGMHTHSHSNSIVSGK